ncbi:PLC-like phosphodiesterase [Xylona heveae TC161]|uniref:PLC-like phosphodiesterase n=1 Tax=Xylona heveae (strain CBS 132557 / TC161) TaxID=1328760 RepID=A0A165GJL9_XYLHT|nr:PLC-like phosphodiesterase [Xylona heveae TC161]KZF22270.1 PLC-like phosphodiesterase [Xylona heveae TC161]
MATPPPLTIRNLTSTPLELKVVERYAAPTIEEPPSSGIANITRPFTNFISNTTTTLSPNNSPRPKASRRPSAPQLAETSQSFSRDEVSISIPSFSTSKTDLEHGPEILRLTFEADSQRYRVDVPSPSNASSTLVPLTPDPRHAYTAIYLPQDSFLAIFSSANLSSWMKELRDETPLSALSIPGTHNSPTCHRALPSVRCQAVSPRKQLENGVRFFDIRVQPENPADPTKDGLILVHGVFPISLTGNKYFRDLVNVVQDFLNENPSETVILSVKREGTGNATDEQLGRILRDHYAGDVHHWFTAPRVPTLGEARKKIVLMRRFVLEDGLKHEWDGAGWCINAESWAYNTPHDTSPGGDVCVQDFCEVLETENIDKKIEYSTQQLERAGQCVCQLPPNAGEGEVSALQAGVPEGEKQPLYINFLSASNFWKVGCWPEKIAAKLNPAVIDYLCRRHNESDADANAQVDGAGAGGDKGDGSTGIVVCDWVGNNDDWDLVRCIVGMNGKLEMREKQAS